MRQNPELEPKSDKAKRAVIHLLSRFGGRSRRGPISSKEVPGCEWNTSGSGIFSRSLGRKAWLSGDSCMLTGRTGKPGPAGQGSGAGAGNSSCLWATGERWDGLVPW